MRSVACLVLVFTAAVGFAQEPRLIEEPQPKFGIPYLGGLYPQSSAKQTLDSVLKAIDKGRFDYLVAHLMDETFVDSRIAVRAVEILPAVERDLRAKRDKQRQDPASVPPEEKLSLEPKAFDTQVQAEARNRAFKVVVADVKEKLGDDPESLKELKRFSREGTAAEAGDTATITLRDVKDRKVFLKKKDGRWFVENRQADDGLKDGK